MENWQQEEWAPEKDRRLRLVWEWQEKMRGHQGGWFISAAAERPHAVGEYHYEQEPMQDVLSVVYSREATAWVRVGIEETLDPESPVVLLVEAEGVRGTRATVYAERYLRCLRRFLESNGVAVEVLETFEFGS